MIIKNLIKIFLLIVVPLLVLGFNALEETAAYSSIFSVRGVESALDDKLTTNFGEAKKLMITREDSTQFDQIWDLIKNNTEHPIPNWKPHTISRLAIENGAYVTLPDVGQVVLIPESTPIVAARTEFVETTTKEDVFVVGTVEDLRDWLEAKKRRIRACVDIIIALASMTLGLLVEFGWKRR